MADVPVEAVLFDWGGTLTPWKTIDFEAEWQAVARVAAPGREAEAAAALYTAAETVWARAREEHRSSTLVEICTMAGLAYDEAHFVDYRRFWEHATITDEDVLPLFSRLKVDGLKVGVLSNTVWPREWHEEFFRRDGVLDLLDGAVYTSEVPWTKPAPEVFLAAMRAVGVEDPAACVYVGDRLFEDVWGAANAGMRTVLVPHSDIPASQHGHSKGEPDAVVERLGHVYDVVTAWNS